MVSVSIGENHEEIKEDVVVGSVDMASYVIVSGYDVEPVVASTFMIDPNDVSSESDEIVSYGVEDDVSS